MAPDARTAQPRARAQPGVVAQLRARLEQLAGESVEAAPIAEEDEAILAARLA